MKTIMAVLMLLISTSVLAVKPDCGTNWVPACDNPSGKTPPGLVAGDSQETTDKIAYSVPEPSTLSLLGLGVVALVVSRKRKI
jgi:hypothetical protein